MAQSFDEGKFEKSTPVSFSSDVESEQADQQQSVVDKSRFDKIAAEEDLQSLEYEDDWFFSVAANNPTPSFDEVEDDDEENAFWTLEPDIYEFSEGSDGESCSPPKPGPRVLVARSGKLIRRVRLGLQDLDERRKNYKRILASIKQKMAKLKSEEPSLVISSEENDFQNMTEEDKAKQQEIWQNELAKVEEEIETLKSVLKSKMRLSQQLKKNLGYTMWRELSDDFNQSVKSVKETSVYQSVEGGLSNIGKAVVESPVYHSVEDKMSQVGKVVSENPVYQRTESVVKMTAESTRSILGGLTGGFTQKLGQIKNSESFRSLEDKVGSAYDNVKTKVSASRSNSMQSFDDALREETARRAAASPTSPTIPEGKPLS